MRKLDSTSFKCPLAAVKCWLKAIEVLYFIDLQVYTEDYLLHYRCCLLAAWSWLLTSDVLSLSGERNGMEQIYQVHGSITAAHCTTVTPSWLWLIIDLGHNYINIQGRFSNQISVKCFRTIEQSDFSDNKLSSIIFTRILCTNSRVNIPSPKDM